MPQIELNNKKEYACTYYFRKSCQQFVKKSKAMTAFVSLNHIQQMHNKLLDRNLNLRDRKVFRILL